MRFGLVVTCVGFAMAILAGCTESTSGIKPVPAPSTSPVELPLTAGAPAPTSIPPTSQLPPPPPVTVTPDKIESILASRTDVGAVLGTTLGYEYIDSDPPTSTVTGAPDCTHLHNPKAADLGSDWTTYRRNYYRETKDETSYIVGQVAVLFPSAKDVAGAFTGIFPPSAKSACANARIGADDQQWVISDIRQIDQSAAKWTTTQLQDGQEGPPGSRWSCFYDFRHRNNALFGAYLCQYGDGIPGVTTIVDRIAAWIPE
ncbi:MAG: sensor domain-containing protein [Mycobacterium sp.]